MAVATAAALSASVSAQSIFPAQPRYLEPVYYQLDVGRIGLAYTSVQSVQVSMQGSAILVTVQTVHCSDLCSYGVSSDVELGRFPAGSYSVIVRYNSDPPDSLSFSVSAPSIPRNLTDFSGLWWVPSEPGWGLGIWQGPTNIIFASWFVYDATGIPTWYTLQAQNGNSNANGYGGQIYKTRGPYFGGPFDPALVAYSTVGRGSLYFYNSKDVRFDYVVDGVTGVKFLNRQAIE